MRGFVKLAVATAAGVLMATGAQAAIVNISAVTATGMTPVVVHLNAGVQYQISWVGIAGGGLYDAFNTNCPDLVCPRSGWRDDVFFTVSAEPGHTFHVTVPNPTVLNGTVQLNSPSAVLAAYQTSQPLWVWDLPTGGGTPTFEAAFQPWLAEPDVDVDVNFFIPDNSRGDNVGGVSLRIAAAVPEPATWGLMIAGFGLAGAGLRRRRSAVLAA